MSDIGQFQQSSFAVPADAAPAVASGVRANDNALATKHNSHDNDHTIHVLTFANLAAFTAAASRSGALAVALDTGKMYLSSGVAWVEVPYRPTATALTAADIAAGTFPAGSYTFPGLSIAGALAVTTAKTTLAATAAGYASLNLPHGTAPSSPANGDVWTTSGGLYARINSTTKQFISTDLTASYTPMVLVRCTTGKTLNSLLYTIISWDEAYDFADNSTECAWVVGTPTKVTGLSATNALYKVHASFRYTGTKTDGGRWYMHLVDSPTNTSLARVSAAGQVMTTADADLASVEMQIDTVIAANQYLTSSYLFSGQLELRIYNPDGVNRTLTPSANDFIEMSVQRIL